MVEGRRWRTADARSSSSMAAGGRSVDLGVETLRGVAILLLVSYHAIDGPDQGLVDPSAHDVFRYAAYATENIRMPLFTVISGYLYGRRPLDGPVRPFMAGKARRLLLPFVVLSTATFALRWAMPSPDRAVVAADWWRIYLYRFEQFWYLPALMLVFTVVVVLERGRVLARPWGVVAALVVAIAARPLLFPIELLNIDGFVYLLPFFLLGCGVARHGASIGRRAGFAIVAVAFAGLGLQQLVWFGVVDVDAGRDSLIGTLTGLAVGFALLRHRRPVGALASVGRNSFPIYLFHILGIAVAVQVLERLGIVGQAPSFGAKVVVAIVGSIAVDALLRRSPITATVVLGQRWTGGPVTPSRVPELSSLRR